MRYLLPLVFLLLISCNSTKNQVLQNQIQPLEKIEGTEAYLNSPFVSAGNRVYVVGHQNGSFPDLGWHVNGEMGGVWDHPIKLMDGYALNILDDQGNSWCLDDAINFTNFPVGNIHHFKNEKMGITAKRFQFVPDDTEGVVVEYLLNNESNSEKILQVSFTGMVDLSPVWLADSLDIEDGYDKVRWDEQIVNVKDSLNDWFVVFGSDQVVLQSQDSPCRYPRKGMGKDVTISSEISMKPNSTISLKYFIAGSYQSLESAKTTYQDLKVHSKELLAEKISRYQSIAEINKLTLPDKELEQMYRWTKYNSDWLVREVPEIGRALSAGIPDYPWWFGTDNSYIIQGLMSAGMHEEALSTIDVIIKLSKEKNGSSGKIMHEASTNGVVYNPGNLNTTPNFITAMWDAYEWTGNQKLLDQYEYIKAGISWLESQDHDGNGYPDGPGMMEIHGLHTEMIDVVVYQAKAYESAASFARCVGDFESEKNYLDKASKLKQRINSDWWVASSGSYADFRANKKQTIELIKSAIIRADTINKPWSEVELRENLKTIENQQTEDQQGYVVHHNWVVNTPMEMGLADHEKAIKSLETARKYRNRFGMFVTGIDRDENQEKAEKWKSFSYVGAVMTLPTGVQAIGEARYGNADEALKYLKMLQNSFSYALPGSMYEVSPDFGMITQGWNIYAVALPIVNWFFGIQPNAADKKIILHPNMPSSWSDASLTNIRIGENELNVTFSREGDTLIYSISQKLPDWEIVFESAGKKIINGENSEMLMTTTALTLTGEQNELRIIP